MSAPERPCCCGIELKSAVKILSILAIISPVPLFLYIIAQNIFEPVWNYSRGPYFLIVAYFLFAEIPACFTAYWAMQWNMNDSYETRKFFSIGMKAVFIEAVIRFVILIITATYSYSEFCNLAALEQIYNDSRSY